ncbi:hypothetical protein RDI58_002294 [Solanum bulbocastanum]|uniref:Uncharacterized protein n=1 Tax=Solanum bulbocastanum TaxID=147425 RepID=A0AAN8YQQ9_SOLBU
MVQNPTAKNLKPQTQKTVQA